MIVTQAGVPTTVAAVPSGYVSQPAAIAPVYPTKSGRPKWLRPKQDSEKSMLILDQLIFVVQAYPNGN